MKIFEYQAKKIFRELGIKTPDGIVCTNVEEVTSAAAQIGMPCMIKAQVLSGGRGKAGLVRLAKSVEQAGKLAKSMFSSGNNVHKILVENCVAKVAEIYLSVSIDPVSANFLIMACSEGGVEIEEVGEAAPEKIIREYVDIARGLQNFQLSDMMFALGIDKEVTRKFSSLVRSLYNCFHQYDAELAEINPVFITEDGDVVAGDGKLILDDNSLFRHPEFPKTREYFDTDMEYASALEGIPYLQFDGDISLMCAGAGLTTTVYDLINYEGGTVANYLEFGGPNYMKAEKAMEICLQNKSKVILIVTFGTIARADVIAEGVVNACARLKPDRPLITCIRGTNEEGANDMLKKAGITCVTDTEEAVRCAVSYCAREAGGSK